MERFGNTRCLSHKGGDAGTLREANLAAPHKPKNPFAVVCCCFLARRIFITFGSWNVPWLLIKMSEPWKGSKSKQAMESQALSVL